MGDQGNDDTGLLMGRLTDEFRSVLDETVIIAIVGDYDLALQFDEARGILQALSKDAIAEDAYGFNPAGLDVHTGHQDDPGAQWPPHPDSCNSTSGSKPFTDLTDPTDLSDVLSESFESLELPDGVNVSTLDEDGKVAELKVMFPSLRELDLRFALKKADGDFIKTCEELLNTQYLEENGLRPKGIEGAFRDDDLVGHKKGKKKPPESGVWLVLIPSSRRSNTDTSTSREKAGKAKVDVGYCLKPLDLESGEEAAGSPVSPGATAPDPTARSSSLPRPQPPPGTPKRASSATPGARQLTTTTTTTTSGWRTVQPRQRRTYSELAADAEAARDLTAESFAAAGRAYRRGKSDALFRPVAGVLSERAREQLERSRAARSESYEALVDEQSSAGRIDLHGVPVADGVRIALGRTQEWWAGLGEGEGDGEDRARRARADGGGFTVVTGLGIHSSKGVSRLRQDVGAALKRAGWRVRTETGQFVVTGRA